MNKKDIDHIFERFSEKNPHPVTELTYTNIYTLLIAIILSAQATDISVNKATGALFAVVDTPEKMVALGEERLKEYIKTIGLYNAKAKNVIACSQRLIDHYQSTVPSNREDLASLPGVGRKTANVLLNCAFGEPTMAVDTHVFRVSNRTGIALGKNPLQVELGLEKNIPDKWKQHAHHWLILHGRYVCKARRPECERCIINDLCDYYRVTTDPKTVPVQTI